MIPSILEKATAAMVALALLGPRASQDLAFGVIDLLFAALFARLSQCWQGRQV
jgi:hypothetical protein